MGRSFPKKARNTQKRKRKPVMVVTAEGKNVTEFKYLLSFRSQHGQYTIHFHKAGSITDSFGLLKSIEQYWVENQLSEDLGDKAYVFLDIDCEKYKADRIRQATKKAEHATFIPSNPCFEIWFIFHYEETTHEFLSSDEVIQRLKKYIPEYEKTTDAAPRILPMLSKALRNADSVKRYHDNLGRLWPSEMCNPMTDVPMVIRELQGI